MTRTEPSAGVPSTWVGLLGAVASVVRVDAVVLLVRPAALVAVRVTE